MITSRRTFLSQAALTAGGVSALYARGQLVGANERVRVALIGCGGIGKVDLDTFLLNPEVDCPLICDVDEAQFAKAIDVVEKARGKRPETVRDFRRVLDRKDIDVVVNATPDHWHALPTIGACQTGKDVYSEKPLATSVGESRAMVTATRKFNRVVQMGTHWRSGDHWRDAVEYVQAGRLGRIRQVRAWADLDWLGGIGSPPDCEPPATVDYDFWLGPAPKRPFNPNRFHFNFRWFWDYAGGLMTDWGVHLINVALWAMGTTPPKTITSSGGKFALTDISETPDTQIAVFEFPTYNLIWEHQIQGGIGPGKRPNGLSFCGTEATLIVDHLGWEVIPEPNRMKEGKGTVVEVTVPTTGDLARVRHVRNFLDCIRTRKDPVEHVDIGHFVTSVALLGNVALRTGNKIHWDPVKEEAIGDPAANALLHRQYRAPWKLT